MTDILGEILAHKRAEAAGLDATALKRAALSAPAPRDFQAAVTRTREDMPLRLIAELKPASPSKGLLALDLDMLQVADIYADNGAAAISVLTDVRYFRGKLGTLRRLRFKENMPLPLLRKDFIIGAAQVYESRANGADAILLIVAAFEERAKLAALHSLALDLGMAALVEVHNEPEAEQALELPGIRLIGINNRDLSTFQTNLQTTERLRPMIPPGISVISESGIFSVQDVQRLRAVDVDGVLVGEALVTAPNIPAKVQELAGIQVRAHD